MAPSRNPDAQVLMSLSSEYHYWSDQLQPLGVAVTVGLPAIGRDRCKPYVRVLSRKLPNFAAALNWGIGSSSLNAEVNAFERLHNVRG